MNWQPKTICRRLDALDVQVANYAVDLGLRKARQTPPFPQHYPPLAGMHDVTITNSAQTDMLVAFSEHGLTGRWCWLADVVVPRLPPGESVAVRCPKPLEDTALRFRCDPARPNDSRLLPFTGKDAVQVVTVLSEGYLCYNTADGRYSYHADASMWREIHDRLPQFSEWPIELNHANSNTIDFARRHELADAVPFEAALDIIGSQLTRELRAKPDVLKDVSPEAFESLMGCVLHDMGMTLQLTTRGADGGIDLIAVAGPSISPTTHLVQCKQYTNKKVGVRWVRELLGVKHAHRASKALLMTTSSFTRTAYAFAADRPAEISLIDWDRLTTLLECEE